MNRRSLSTAIRVVTCAALAALLVAAWPPTDARAQTAAGGARRPKICVVLSGGGARGAAHIGVLKVLEEMRIPIDCIAGNSMGSLVAGAYASGMSVPDMEKITAGITYERLFNERPPRVELSVRRKQEDYGLFFGPEVGVGSGGLKTANGVVSGVQLETVLRQLARAKGYRKFDELPIPYRAVATDLVTGEQVIFTEGELANVMRASMSVPGAVAPAMVGEEMLVDGMLVANLPIEAARSMNPDIIIAVDVGTPLNKKAQISGILGVVGQMLGILSKQNVEASLAMLRPNDILITPDLEGFSTADFDILAQIIPPGEVAARKVADRLTPLAIPAAEYAALRERQQVLVTTADPRPIAEIRVDHLRRVNPRAVLGVMKTRVGKPISQNVLDTDMLFIYGMGHFEHVNYRLEDEAGKLILIVDADEKPWGMTALRFGLGLSSDFGGDAYFNLIGSLRKYWINSYGGEWRTNVQIGRESLARTELYQPIIQEGYVFVSPQIQVDRKTADLYQGNQRIARYDMATTLGTFDLGARLRRYGELRVGVVAGVRDPSLDTGPEELSPGEGRIREGAFESRLFVDRIDDVRFPRAGWNFLAAYYNSTKTLGADNVYAKWEVSATGAYSFGDNTVNLSARAGGKANANALPNYDQFSLGGFLRLSGYSTGQLYGQEMELGRLMYYRRLKRGTMLKGAYGGFSLEGGKIGRPLVPDNPQGTLFSASGFVAMDSPVGPAYLAYGKAKDGNAAFYFYLGRPF